MRTNRILLPVFLLAAGFFAAPAARADFDFTFASSPTITAASVSPAGTTDTITNGITILGLPGATFTSVATTGTSTITLTGRNTSGPFDATNGTNTSFLTVLVTSNDTATRNFSLNFDVTYTLADPTPAGGPGPAVVHFLGKLTGLIDGLSPSSTNLSFSLADFNPPVGAGGDVTVGDGNFHFSFDSFQNPGLGPGETGGLTARVAAAAVPEPASIALLGMGGVSACGFITRRRKGVSV
jgi:hypothetical protein